MRAKMKATPGDILERWQLDVLALGTPLLSCFQNWRAWRDGPEGAAVWRAQRAQLIKNCIGWRPWGWWWYEHGRHKPGGGLGREARAWAEYQELKRLGALEPGEARAFETKHPAGPPDPTKADRAAAAVTVPGEAPQASAEPGEIALRGEDTIQ